MNTAQRTVLVIAYGLAIAVLVATVNIVLADGGSGWFNYAPNSDVVFGRPSDGDAWREGLIWLAGIVAWAAGSVWIYRRRPDT